MKFDNIKTIESAEMIVGSRGGKKYLTVEYIQQDGRHICHGIGNGIFLDDLKDMLAECYKKGVDVKIVTEKK